MSIVISQQSTWPEQVVDYLDRNHLKFIGWETSGGDRVSAYEYDQAILEFRSLLKQFSLVGYHCTKLTPYEIEDIRKHGMKLQCGESLKQRVLRLESAQEIDKVVAQKLLACNQADDSNRAFMLWFCFFEPHLAGFYGIHRFFKSWGGEALYNRHENQKITGDALKEIGIPCVIKAKVTISSLKASYYPCSVLIRAYLQGRGYVIDNSIEHEGYSTEDISADQIEAIYQHPSDEFAQLTKCNEWCGESAL
ncbi:hypothetical protein ACWOVX_004332 [Vibrio vulnificus]|nr:hypothetical protein [Vibrio vulnificus]EII2405199.1 hypothetical protein [Vibrio parahaemolyticus]EHH1182953.1 hypothetical protein [Vibrio vulnificus]EHU4850538.1 hypothetical protein [Vibrio vulnificus]EIV8483775.1 hypothetical protein [Vibrio vulnificus]